MSRNVIARLLVGLLIATAVIATGGAGGAGPSQAAPAQPNADSSTYVATCLQSARSLSALFLFDQSDSLTETDPDGVRYDGLRVALRSLAQLSRSDGRDVAVEAAISSFDDEYYPARDVKNWTRLNSGSSDDINSTVDEMVNAAKDKTQPDGGTNFGAAMQGAYDDLKDRGTRGSCRVVFWFTDGQDASDTLSSSACQANSGLIDQMRRDGIVIVGLQLETQTDDLKAISTGSSNGINCGTNPIPSDWADGAYIFASDTAALRRLFGGLGNLVRGCTPQGDRAGRVDPGVRGMGVTIDTPTQATSVRLDAPDGTVIAAATTGSTTAGGYSVLAQSDESYVTLTVDFPPGKGAGEWTVSPGMAVAPDAISYCVFSGLHLARVDPKALPAAGGPAEFVYQAVDAAGQPADLGVYKNVAVGASATTAKGDIRKATAERAGNTIVVRVDSQPVDARLQLNLTTTLTTTSDLALTPLAVNEGVGLALSKAFPMVSPIDQLDLGDAKNKEPATAPLTLLGSSLGPSKVCIDNPTDIVVPDAVKGQSIDVQTGCIDLAQGETRTIDVRVTPPNATTGNGEAVLPIRLIPAAGTPMAGQESLVELPVVWRYENPTSTTIAILIVVVAALLSLILPLAALVGANRVTSRFETKGMRSEVIPVMIGADGPRRQDPLPGNESAVIDSYQMPLRKVGTSRSFTIDSVDFTSKTPWSPFKVPSFTASSSKGRRVLSNVAGHSGDGSSAPVPPALGFVVVAVVSDEDLARAGAEVPAQLVVILRDREIGGSQLDSLMNSQIQWSIITDQWRREAQASAGPDGPDGATIAPSAVSEPDPTLREYGEGLF